MRRTTIYSDSQRSRDENMVAFKKDKIGQALLTISYSLQTKGKNLTNIKIDDSKISEISRPWKDIHIFCLIVFVNKINWFPFYIILRNNLLSHCIIEMQILTIYITLILRCFLLYSNIKTLFAAQIKIVT